MFANIGRLGNPESDRHEVVCPKMQDSGRLGFLSFPQCQAIPFSTLSIKGSTVLTEHVYIFVTVPLSSELQEVAFVRSEDLLKPDVMSEAILLGAGVLVFAILILLLVVALTQAPAPV
jgi:hypothetical protein